MNSGIYKITNILDNKCYIGSSSTIINRLIRHKKDLKANKHHSIHLQRVYNKHGNSIFQYEILLYCDNKDLLFYEQRAINTYKPEYNMCKLAQSCLGFKHTKETKEKMSISGKGRVFSEEHKAKISAALKANRATQEYKDKASISRLGKPHKHSGAPKSDETKKKLSLIAKQQPRKDGKFS